MEIREERQGGILVIAPVGRVDSNTAGELERKLLRGLKGGETRLVIDLESVAYISSAGLRVLLLAANTARPEGGQIVLCSMGESVREVFELAGFTTVFAIEASRDLALARLRGAGPA
jgi:anti-sigma B factor antagonist